MNSSSELKQFFSGVFTPENQFLQKFLPKKIHQPVKRAKLWELNKMHHCPIIGVCLSLEDLIRFARRFDFASSISDEYAMHVEAVGKLSTRNVVSKAIQKYLDTKYRNDISRFNQAKTDDELQALWKESYLRGEAVGAMWALLTHKAVSDKTREIIYADMHMLSHQTGAGQAADIRRLVLLEKENAEIKATLEHQQCHQASTEAKLRKKLNRALGELESLRHIQHKMEPLQKRIAAFESGKAMTEMGRRLMALTVANDELRVAAERVISLDQSLASAQRKIMALVNECKALKDERDALENLLLPDINAEKPCNEQQITENDSIQIRYVLCVGGRVALLPQYRALAKQKGICLIHHDGGQQEALSRLPDLIGRAHAVICPTDCVSHAAYYQLKRHCKQNNKPCLLFKGAGISSFARVLVQLSSSQFYLSNNGIRKLQEITE